MLNCLQVRLALVLSVVCGLLVAEIIGYSRNTLMSHPEWVSGKRLLGNPPVGTAQALSTRNLLAGDRLHLDAWHGFNELLYNGKSDCLGARVRLSPGSWLALEYNRSPAGYCAVRLSRAPERPTCWLEVAPDGRFLRKIPLPLKPGEGWQRVELVGSTARLDAQSAELPVAVREGVVGLRAGMKRTEVDDVTLRKARESFRNWRHFWARAGLASLALALVAVALRSWRGLGYAYYLLTLGLVLYLGFDRLFWSYRYPYVNHLPWTYHRDLALDPLERLRHGLLGSADAAWTQCLPVAEWVGFGPISLGKVAFKMADRYGLTVIGPDGVDWPADTAPPRPARGRRVMLLGTSQTRGSGAARDEESLAFRLQARLGGEVIGAGVSGSNSTELSIRYRERLSRWRPDLLVVNLGNNDTDPQVFERNLTALASPQTVFCQEANSCEATGRLPFLAQRHERMAAVAQLTGLPLVDLHGYMNSPEVLDSGFLWWDLVHMTSYGQDLAAAWLAERLAAQGR